MLNAVIVADYGKNTGTGHLMRCRTLAKELSDKFSVTFACDSNEHFSFVSEFVKGAGASAAAVDELSYIGRSLEADLIIIDTPKATAKLLTDIKNHYKVCAVIDDNNMLPFYDADFVINQNIGAESITYKTRKDTETLLGPSYMMLREEFFLKPPIDISKDVKKIVVTMGGADVKNTTEKILKMVLKRKDFIFDVVVGGAFETVEILKKYERENDNFILHFNADIPELFSKCQGAVSACGVTIYELAALGVPTIGVVTADNQLNTSFEMENCGMIISAGLSEKLSDWYFDQLFEDVMTDKELRSKMHGKLTGIINAGGAKRIKEKIISKLL